MTMKYICLLPGTNIKLGQEQRLVVPDDYGGTGICVGDEVVLQNQEEEILGTALVRSMTVLMFAHLQTRDFNNSALPGLTTWHESAEVMRALVPGFSITDRTTVFDIETVTLLEPGLKISPYQPAPEPLCEEVIPDEASLFDGLESLAEELTIL